MMVNELPTILLDLLANEIVLDEILPYLDLKSRLALEATSRTSRDLLRTPLTYRYLDLSRVKGAQPPKGYTPVDNGGVNWRAERMDEALTEDEFYSGPLRGIFWKLKSRQILSGVRTLILDGLSVPAELVYDILVEDRFSVHILSIRRVQNLNERKVCQALRHVTRPTRPEGTPRVKAIYCFDPSIVSRTGKHSEQESAAGVTSREGAQVGGSWSHASHSRRMFKPPACLEWPDALVGCANIIAFDAVLCRGPRHSQAFGDALNESFLLPKIATVALDGCTQCGSSWEEPAEVGRSPQSHLPLVAPVPTHNTTVQCAQRPVLAQGMTSKPSFLRCDACMSGRLCERCGKWWCEKCYLPSQAGKRFGKASTDVFINMNMCSTCLAVENLSNGGFGMWG